MISLVELAAFPWDFCVMREGGYCTTPTAIDLDDVLGFGGVGVGVR